MDMSLMRDFMFVACTSWRTDETRQPVRWARVQLRACNVRVQQRVQPYYTVSPTDSSPILSSALRLEPEWSRLGPPMSPAHWKSRVLNGRRTSARTARRSR